MLPGVSSVTSITAGGLAPAGGGSPVRNRIQESSGVRSDEGGGSVSRLGGQGWGAAGCQGGIIRLAL